MNATLANHARFGDEYQSLASSVLGTGINAGFLERLVYLALIHNITNDDTTGLARHVWETLSAQGRRMVKDGKTVETEEENLAEVRSRVACIVTQRLPIWRHMGVL